jgi:hypothetical protein
MTATEVYVVCTGRKELEGVEGMRGAVGGNFLG